MHFYALYLGLLLLDNGFWFPLNLNFLSAVRYRFRRSPNHSSNNGGPFFDYRSFENTMHDGASITDEQFGTDSPEIGVSRDNNNPPGSRQSDTLRMNQLTWILTYSHFPISLHFCLPAHTCSCSFVYSPSIDSNETSCPFSNFPVKICFILFSHSSVLHEHEQLNF